MQVTRNELMESAVAKLATTETIEGIGEVGIRELSGDDFDFIRGAGDQRAMFARTVVAGVCDDAGKPLFQRKEVEAINKRFRFEVLRRISECVQKHGGILTEDVEEIAGNLETTTPNGSGTD